MEKRKRVVVVTCEYREFELGREYPCQDWCKTLFVFIHMYIIQSEKNNNNISLFCVVTYECVEENIHA